MSDIATTSCEPTMPQFGSHEWFIRSAGVEGRNANHVEPVVDLQRVGTPRLVKRVELDPVDDVAAETGDGGAAGDGRGGEDPEAFGAGGRHRRVRVEPGLLHGTSLSVAVTLGGPHREANRTNRIGNTTRRA